MKTASPTIDFTKPQPTSAVSQAFGDIQGLMPDYNDIPEDYRRERGESVKWHAIQSRWFFFGLKGATFKPKDGINLSDALGHLKCIQGSFQPKHEHKQAAVAWLMSLWFDDIIVPEVTQADRDRLMGR